MQGQALRLPSPPHTPSLTVSFNALSVEPLNGTGDPPRAIAA